MALRGSPIRAYVWADHGPIAQIDRGTTDRVSYLHLDHLGTPKRATNSAGLTVWRAESDAFCTTVPNEDPDQDGTLTTVNLRFPGQYYDQETGLHYNWHRYYDPRTGRYIASDPIGLVGGLNTYAYVYNNPLRYIDPTGESATVLEWCISNPRACGGAAGGAAAAAGSAAGAAILGGIGAALYSPAACPSDEDEEKCRKEWEEAYRICAKEMSRGGHRGVTGGYTNEFQCAKGLVSQRCGGNRVD